MQGLLITATDTGAGKTEVTAGIAGLWRRQRREFTVCKPVATGGARHDGDAGRLARAGGFHDLEAITPYQFREPAAPPVAARAEGVSLCLEQLTLAVRRRYREGAAMLVEGVGGLLCPLTEQETVADLAAALRLPLVVVARRSLGTINHTLLTLEAARSRRLRIAGLVINETAPVASLADEMNVAELRGRIDVPLLAVVPYRAGGYGGDVPALGAVDWWSLAR